MKLYPPVGEPMIHIALLTGHTLAVMPEGTDVPREFLSAAIEAGCVEEREIPELTEDDTASDDEIELALERALKIREALNTMLDNNNANDFKNDGKPNLLRVSHLVGFKADKAEVEAIFNELSES